MILHGVPALCGRVCSLAGCERDRVTMRPRASFGEQASLAGERGDGRICGHIRKPARPERSGVGAGTVSGGSGARGPGRCLLLSSTRPAGNRWRRRAPAGSNREAPGALRNLLGGSRKPRHGLLRREPNPEDRSGRPDRAAGGVPSLCRNLGRGSVRRPRVQVPDLGAEALRRAPERDALAPPVPDAGLGRSNTTSNSNPGKGEPA